MTRILAYFDTRPVAGMILGAAVGFVLMVLKRSM